MTPLARKLRDRIARTGSIPVADFMAAALGDPEHGYYMTRDPFGRGGDSTTAPEISQMFGELLGAWCAATWQAVGAPNPVRLVELGPGRGTLMADALRAAAGAPEFLAAARVAMVETSPVLARKQRQALAAAPLARPATWHVALDEVVAGPLLLLANEFLDALPIRQFERTGAGWRERLVDGDGGAGFRFVTGDAPCDDAVPPGLRDAAAGAVFEAAPAVVAVITAIARRLAADGGAALVVDYGHSGPALGDTLQAVKGHDFHPALADPGDCDLTAHVDFATVGDAARDAGAAVYGPVGQGLFLERLGIAARAAALARDKQPGVALGIAAARRRLVADGAMGRLFKVLCLAHPALPTPAGFEAGEASR